MKKKFGLIKIMIVASTAALLCACEKQPAAVEEPPVELVEETVVEEPEPEVTEPEEIEEPEVVKETEEISEYAQVPAELLDENGVYIPEAVTADMLREIFDKIEIDYVGHDEYVDGVESTILKCNYPFITELDFETIVNEYEVDLGLNYIPFYEDYDVEPEKFYFDPYLRFEARIFYDLHYEREKIWENINDNNGINTQEDMDLVERKIDCLMYEGMYAGDKETILVPFTINDVNAKLESGNDKDAKIALSIMLKQYGTAYGDSMTYNDLFDNMTK